MSVRLRTEILKLHQRLTGRQILEQLFELNRTQWLDRERLLEMQREKLYRVIEYAYQYVPYYQRIFDQSGFHPDDLRRDFNSFRKIPLLTKELIRKNQDDMLTIEPERRRQLTEVNTSGSTGRPLVFKQDNDFRDSVTADIQRHLGWAGWTPGQRHAYIWGTRFETRSRLSLRSRLIDWCWNRFLTNAYSLTEASLEAFAKKMHRRRPGVLFGYASSLHRFAQYIRSSRFRDITLSGVISSAEVLWPPVRRTIEDTFQCPVFDRYGSKELGGIACECEAHAGQHISAENNYIEILTDGRPASPGETGDFVITNLNNLGMPFIRFQNEDAGAWCFQEDCPCGRISPRLENIQGRIVDAFKTCDGRTVWAGFAGAGFSAFTHPSIKQFQIVQKSLDLMVIRLVKADDIPPSALTQLERTTQRAFGGNVRVQFEFPDEIPRLPSGKHRYAISELSESPDDREED